MELEQERLLSGSKEKKRQAGIASSRPDAGPRGCGSLLSTRIHIRKDEESKCDCCTFSKACLTRGHNTDWTSRGGGSTGAGGPPQGAPDRREEGGVPEDPENVFIMQTVGQTGPMSVLLGTQGTAERGTPQG